MGLFSKKNDESAKASNDLALEIIQDVQTHLKIKQKQEAPKMPLFISISKIPNPEIFATPLDNEIAEVDEAEIAAQEHAKQEEEEREKQALEAIAKAKAMAEQLQQEEEAKLAQEETKEQEDIVDDEVIEEIEDNEEVQSEETINEEQPTEDTIEESSETEESSEETQEEVVEEAAPEEIIEEAQQEETAPEEPVEEEKVEEPQEDKQETVEEIETLEEDTEVEEKKEGVIEEPQEEKKEAPTPPPSSNMTFSAATFNLKKKTIVKASAAKKSGVAAIKEEADAQKAELEAIKREEALAKAAAIREAEKKAEMERLKDVILIGNIKKPDPELGKFEIQWSNNNALPYKMVLKSNVGKVLYESTAIRTKPNELTAVMFKDICNTGSFVFIKAPAGYAFKMLDSRKRVFYISKAYRQLIDAQKMAALIKKFGLSANYIDDVTNS